jgi:hypothetical protein
MAARSLVEAPRGVIPPVRVATMRTAKALGPAPPGDLLGAGRVRRKSLLPRLKGHSLSLHGLLLCCSRFGGQHAPPGGSEREPVEQDPSAHPCCYFLFSKIKALVLRQPLSIMGNQEVSSPLASALE